ncbi:MAG TPA: hypothetical protein DCS82_11290 [Rhodospirillaceae bacterium]|nr:hypothetical protein [Rhodospirillaceae bacterium]HAT36293.1 hypothetical protein [Rhodospirillaceae bacterium]
MIPIILGLWFLLSLSLNFLGVFEARADAPPIAFGLSVIGPPILFGILYARWTAFRESALALDLKFLTAIQAWRLVGVMFLVLYSFDMLPGSFAWPAGVGDIIVGLYAPFVVVAIANNSANWHRQAVILNILGLLDFVGAIGGGVLSGGTPAGILTAPGAVTSDIMQTLPLALIPTFFVPFWIILHIISLIKLRQRS